MVDVADADDAEGVARVGTRIQHDQAAAITRVDFPRCPVRVRRVEGALNAEQIVVPGLSVSECCHRVSSGPRWGFTMMGVHILPVSRFVSAGRIQRRFRRRELVGQPDAVGGITDIDRNPVAVDRGGVLGDVVHLPLRGQAVPPLLALFGAGAG